jgi:hypothetical protein
MTSGEDPKMVAGGRGRHIIVGLLVGALLGGSARGALASEGSKGSNDSSNSSTDSSQNSTDSSNRSENSTESSPKDSSEGSSDGSSKNQGAVLVSVALLLVGVGATVVGVVKATGALAQADEPRRLRMLARFLQRHHALVARDVVMGEGPLLAAWSRSLGLSTAEGERLSRSLDGSPEQAELLAALNGSIDKDRARRFAVAFTRVGRRALGDERLRAVALAALR